MADDMSDKEFCIRPVRSQLAALLLHHRLEGWEVVVPYKERVWGFIYRTYKAVEG